MRVRFGKLFKEKLIYVSLRDFIQLEKRLVVVYQLYKKHKNSSKQDYV